MTPLLTLLQKIQSSMSVGDISPSFSECKVSVMLDEYVLGSVYNTIPVVKSILLCTSTLLRG